MAKYLQCAAKCRTLIRTLLARFLLLWFPKCSRTADDVDRAEIQLCQVPQTRGSVASLQPLLARQHRVACRFNAEDASAPKRVPACSAAGDNSGTSACAQRWNHFA